MAALKTPEEQRAPQIDGAEAHKAGVKWWENPHPSGSVAAFQWDTGHTMARLHPEAPCPFTPGR